MQLLSGTGFQVWWWWILGANIGKEVVIGNVDLPDDPNLVVLGDGAVVMDDVVFETCKRDVRSGSIVASPGSIHIGAKVLLGLRAVIQAGTDLHPHVITLPMSAVSPGVVEERAVIMGAPAIKAFDRPETVSQDLVMGTKPLPLMIAPWTFIYHVVVKIIAGFVIPFASCLLNILLVTTSWYPMFVMMIWMLTTLSTGGLGWSFTAVVAITPILFWVFVLCLMVVVVLDKWLLGWAMMEGKRFNLGGITYHRRLSTIILQGFSSRACLDPLRGSIFAPLYLRLLGASVHPTSLINTLQLTDPDLVTVGPGGILDEGVALCPCSSDYSVEKEEQTNKVKLGYIQVQAGGRVGAGAVIMGDCTIGEGGVLNDNSLLLPGRKVGRGAKKRGVMVDDDNSSLEDGTTTTGVADVIHVPVYL